MGIYDKKISVYDNLDCLEDAANEPEVAVTDFDSNDLNDAKGVISNVFDDLGTIIEDLEEINDLHTDDELTLDRLIEFLKDDLPDIITDLEKVRGRLY